MSRALLFVFCSTAVFAQAPRSDSFPAAILAYQDAKAHGSFDEAAARREEARSMIAQGPVTSPQWMNRVQSVAQIYQSSGRRAQARAVLEDALSHADSQGELQLLNTLADFWQQDGNLLKALRYREKAVAALESAPPNPPPSSPVAMEPANRTAVRAANGVFISGASRFAFFGGRPNNVYLYQQLEELYRQLGRPEAAAKVAEKMRTLAKDDPRELAAFYERHGELDEAVAQFRKQAAQAAANPQAQPWEVIGPLQSISSLYQREQRWEDAAAALQQAVRLTEQSGQPDAPGQVASIQLNLARLFQQSGQNRAAEQIYQTLLRETASERSGAQSQVVQSYADFLSGTKRAAQAEDLLKDYMANHTLQPWEESNILFSLSRIAGSDGRKEVADQYQRAGQEGQRAAQSPQPDAQLLIGPDLQKAQAAAGAGKLTEAVDLALRVIASAPLAVDREQVAWQIPNIANGLANRKAPEEGDRLYRQLFPMLEAMSADNVGPLFQARQQYVRFLIGLKDRWGQVPAAIDEYRQSVVSAQGAETAEFEQVIRFQIDFARAKNAHADAVQGAEALLAFEESLSGTTSQPYMRAAQTAADAFQYSGNLERALSLHRQIVAIADLTLPARDTQRGYLRMTAALAFAGARQFDEAERYSNEAIAIGEQTRPPQADIFTKQAAQIQQMKKDAQSGATAQSQWFKSIVPLSILQPPPKPAEPRP